MGGGIRKSHLNSKKIVLSLATISFLASCANAKLNSEIKTYDEANKNLKARSASVYSPEARTDTTINSLHTDKVTITGSGTTNSLTIGSSGTLGSIGNNDRIIYAHASGSNTLTLTNLTNNGTINGKVAVEHDQGFTGTITVNTFANTGQVNGQIYMGVWGGNSGTLNIEKFDNSGTITASNGQGVFFEGKNTHIKTFNNSGTIQSNNSQGVNITKASIQTFTNKGLISGSNGISMSSGTINTFINTGTINSTGKKEPSEYGASSGISLSYNTIKTFNNTGLISGIFGLNLMQATIENFTNKGTIESTSNHDFGAAINLITSYGAASVINNFTNEGTIKSKSNGIFAEAGNKIETLVNKGFIEADLNGISFYDYGSVSGNKMELGKIILEEGSSIKAGHNGINIDHGSSKVIEADAIEVKKGAVVSGNNAGIYLGGGKEINAQITISGEVSGGSAGIVNEGIIGGSSSSDDGNDKKGGIIISGGNVSSSSGGSGIVNQGNGSIAGEIKVESGGSVEGGITNTGSGSISGSIVVESGGKLDSITNTSTSDTGISGSITNNSDNKLEISNGEGATIGGGITNNGNADLVISNQGSVGKDKDGNTVTNNGSGSVGIKDWVVSTDKETGKLDTVVVGGSGANNVKVENITVDQSNVNLEELGNINNIISGVNQGNIGNIGTNGGGEISLSYDPLTGKLSTDYHLNASISGATFRSLISTTSRRSTFIDNVMGNSMQTFALASSSKSQSIAMSEKGNLYADASDYIKSDLNNGNYGSNKEHSLFILPYTSSQNVELSLNEESKGHTKGTIIGYSTLKDSGIYGVYAGYEDTKMSSTYFDINNRTYYAGLKYFNTLFTTEKGQEVYIKAQGKAALIKNDLTKKIGNNEAKAEPNSYAYGVNTALGMNFISNKDIFSPEVGLAYEGGYTEAFSMKDTIGQATVQGGERTYANYLNLFSTKTSFTWFRDWLPNLKTSVELGAKFNINPKVEAEARFGNIKVSDEFDLPRVQKFVSTSLIIPVNEAFYFSLNYNGMFDKDGNTHTGFAQFNYLW
ncbi:TPA: autotransporter outer membrane beta-barrel domain-containing protein [Campylobacter jejuni]|nr:autotransporter outer membrane beta-barrel domain-containing protein [Campylobacter jejuni]